jgi:hypothetical protein
LKAPAQLAQRLRGVRLFETGELDPRMEVFKRVSIDEAVDARLARLSPEQLGCGLQIRRRSARFLNHEIVIQ